MKRIVMTTKTQETVNMAAAGKFRTGEPQDVEDQLADSLLKRRFPKFEEVKEETADEKPAAKKSK